MSRNTAHSPPKRLSRLSGLLRTAALVCLAGACLCLALRCQADEARSARLTARLSQLEQDLTRQQAAFDQQQTDLEQARQTISLLEEYPVLDNGQPPAYTQLYPEMYAPPREEAVTSEGKTVYLTFDDGPSENTDRILEILDRYGVKATFFVVGRTGGEDQRRMRDIVSAGHTLAVHSWSHDYKKIYASVEAFLDDFHQLYQWIYEVTGTYPQVFRFPGGSINGYNRGTYQEIIAEMTRRGFVYFDWNVSAQDATASPLPAGTVAANCLKGIGRGQAVVLAHDSAARTTTVEALPTVIEGYRDAGYVFAPLTPEVEPVFFGYKREA